MCFFYKEKHYINCNLNKCIIIITIIVINAQQTKIRLGGLFSRTNPQVCVDGGVAGCARQILVLAVGDVLVCACVTVLLGQAKVNDVHQVALLAQAHQEVVWLHVPVDEVLGVDVLYPADL